MSVGENIFNAFSVVEQTHKNISRLIDFCKNICDEKGEYELMSPKFLRYKSDNDFYGWNTSQIFLVFQDTSCDILETGWRDGPIYLFEINLFDRKWVFDEKVPMVEICKMEYKDISSWSAGVSSASYYAFKHPLYDYDYKNLEEDILYYDEFEDVFSERYWGVKRVVCKTFPLTEITNETAYNKIFGNFNALKNK